MIGIGAPVAMAAAQQASGDVSTTEGAAWFVIGLMVGFVIFVVAMIVGRP